MPYILVRGNLASYGNKYPWRVLVSGLKATDIEQLSRFPSGGYCDNSTLVYLQHPCVILTALEVLGYKVVASSSTTVKQDCNEYMWTMRKDFSEPEPEPVIKAEPVNTVGSETYYYVGIRASPFAAECAVFGLSNDESSALSKRFGSYDSVVVNGVNIKAPPFTVINTLAELGYKVICSTGEAEILWTLQREI